MSVDVEWQDENGQTIHRHENWIEIDLAQLAAPDSPCLRFIDPWGDTTFNSLQIPHLEKELETVAAGSGKAAQSADALLSFIKRQSDQCHVYLKFFGD